LKDQIFWMRAGIDPSFYDTGYVLDGLAVWQAVEGELERAARLFGAEEEFYRRFELDFMPRMRSEHETALAAVKEALGAEAFAAAWQAGQALSPWQALEWVTKEMGLDGQPANDLNGNARCT
jgi:2-hydroxychromene-2-carboxylate isomerase